MTCFLLKYKLSWKPTFFNNYDETLLNFDLEMLYSLFLMKMKVRMLRGMYRTAASYAVSESELLDFNYKILKYSRDSREYF